MRRLILFGTAPLLALAACATNAVEPLSQDTYRITLTTPVEQNRTPAETAVSAQRMDEVRLEATRRSQEHCARQRRQAVELDSMLSIQGVSNSPEPIHISEERWVGVQTLTFRCE